MSRHGVVSLCASFAICILPVPSEAGRPAADPSGVWDWANLMRLPDGRVRAERETWRLWVEGGKVEGSYHRVVRYQAAPGKVFACNGLNWYETKADFKVEGRFRHGRLSVKEVSVRVQAGPCENGQRTLQEYHGRLRRDGRLVLDWGDGSQVLVRRNLTGLWVAWGRRTLPNGDSEDWKETWRILDQGGTVRGIRDRWDVRRSNDGQTFRCNSRLFLSRWVRWPFQGRVGGGRLLVKLGPPLRRATPCENRRIGASEISLELGDEPDELKVRGPDSTVTLVRQDHLAPGIGGGADGN